jgi:hypothetical protein
MPILQTALDSQGMQPLFGIVANVKSDRVLRTGAKVWIYYCNGDASHPMVSGISKSGHSLQKYTHYKRLKNFRAAWVPAHLRGCVESAWPDKESAADIARKLAAMWSGVRYYNRDGAELREDGISESEALRRAYQRS